MAKNSRKKNYPFIYYPSDNKYTKWYNKIINIVKHRPIVNPRKLRKIHGPGTFEIHHVIPEGLGGPHINKNKVIVTPREHIILHHILCYMFEHNEVASDSCWYAYKRAMSRLRCNGFPVSSRAFERAKLEGARRMSEDKKGKSGHLHTEEHKKYMSNIMTGRKKTSEHIENHRKSITGKPAHPNTIAVASSVWEIIYPNGEIKIITNLKELCRNDPNLNWNGIYGYFRKKPPTYKGHKIRKIA